MPANSKREKRDEQHKVPRSDVPEEPGKPINERNQDQGKLQQTFESQKHERMTSNGDKKMP